MAAMNVPQVPPSARDDAIKLHRAFQSYGCDTAAVVNILAHRLANQRSLIENEYRTMYHEELSDRLDSELSNERDLKDAVSWMLDSSRQDAQLLREALSGNAGGLKAATEVICSRTRSEVQKLEQIYLDQFDACLEHDIKSRASDDPELKKLLLACINSGRREDPKDVQLAEHDVESLQNARQNSRTLNNTFVRIFTGRSREHLKFVASYYKRRHRNSLKRFIKEYTLGHFKVGLLTILQFADNSGKYFAKVLHEAMTPGGVNDATVIRVIVTRAEVDMLAIKAEYQKKYGSSLVDEVHSVTSGHCRTFLVSLLGATPHWTEALGQLWRNIVSYWSS